MDDQDKIIETLRELQSHFRAMAGIACSKQGRANHVESAKAIGGAIALLKAQEPRVMALEEVLDLKYDDVVYLEDFPTKSVFSAIVIDVIPKLLGDIGVVQFRYAPTWNGINNADLSYYGKVWRCWTSRPTDAQRKAEPWAK